VIHFWQTAETAGVSRIFGFTGKNPAAGCSSGRGQKERYVNQQYPYCRANNRAGSEIRHSLFYYFVYGRISSGKKQVGRAWLRDYYIQSRAKDKGDIIPGTGKNRVGCYIPVRFQALPCQNALTGHCYRNCTLAKNHAARKRLPASVNYAAAPKVLI